MTLRKQDSQAEDAVALFLDRHFYPEFVRNQTRYSDLETQLKGVDVVFDFEEHTGLLVDEKAAAHFVNKNIPTFAFEVDFIGIDGHLKEGWLFDKKKETQYYLLSWIQAARTRNFTCEDISQLEVILIDRLKTIGLLKAFGMDKNRAIEISQKLRAKNQFGVSNKNSATPFYFYFTKRLTEKPINIIIIKNALIKLAALHKIIAR